MDDDDTAARARQCPILTVPGLGNSGPDHWQTVWERRLAADRRTPCRRVELGLWDNPERQVWIAALDRAIRAAADTVPARPVVLVAHSLGCLTVAWWAHRAGAEAARLVAGALLVAPPGAGRCLADPRLAGFAPPPSSPLPFPAILVASRNDPYSTFAAARELATDWGATLIDAGAIGHINADSGLGDWPFGRLLLTGLVNGGGPDGAWLTSGAMPRDGAAHAPAADDLRAVRPGPRCAQAADAPLRAAPSGSGPGRGHAARQGQSRADLLSTQSVEFETTGSRHS